MAKEAKDVQLRARNGVMKMENKPVLILIAFVLTDELMSLTNG